VSGRPEIGSPAPGAPVRARGALPYAPGASEHSSRLSAHRGSRSRWLALGVALPTLLLGAGWLAASFRERASRVREEQARLEGVAAAVRGAVDEGLEDLRRREDERPFYLYNHYYSPPEVLAISDPIALSPLATGPSDSRVVGWFQVDPDGTVRTPWTAFPEEPGPASAARVRAIARSEALADLRALVHGRDAGALVARVRAPEPEVLLAAASPVPRALRRDAPTRRAPEADEEPVTVALNSYTVELANEIQQAQAGDVEAYDRVARRGRQAPLTTRRSVDIEEVQQQQAVPSQRRSGRSSSGGSQAEGEQFVVGMLAREDEQRTAEQVAALTGTPRARPVAPARPPAVTAEPSPPLVPTSIEVDYTPMAWREDRDVLVLSRIVSHEGAAVLQGVVVDRQAIAELWIPEVIARIAAGGPAPRLIDGDERAACALRAHASDTLAGLDLCFDAAALASRIDALDVELRYQIGALLGLLLAVAAAAWAIQRASRRAEELASQRSAFVSAVSHELRTPLTTIRMHAEMLEDELVEPARRPKVFREIVTESVRLSRLVENVLEISRLEEGRRPLRARPADLTAHVAEIVRGQAPFARAKGCELIGPGADAPSIELSFDAQAVEQIVVNLIDNAVKYAPGTIEVDVASEGERAVVRVRDRGPGIPEGERSRVFERFHRVERAETAHKPGTGIGLSLVRDLARAHGGDASVREREGDGCELRVELPLR
jgi:signal transduction histidine kinase